MVALFVYAYCVGVRSSRQIERRCHVDVAFKVICAGLFPGRTTTARSRSRHDQALKHVLSSSLRLCQRTEAAAADDAEGNKLRGRKPKVPEDKAAHKDKKANTTGPEPRAMSTSEGHLQGYNCQAVANEDQMAVAAEVTDEQNGSHQLHPVTDATTAALAEAGSAERPEKLLADAGYCSEENLATFDDDGPDAYVATRNMKNNPARRTGRRGPLRKDATLVEQMDRKVPKKLGRALYRRRQSRTVGHPVQPDGRRGHLLIEGGTPDLTATQPLRGNRARHSPLAAAGRCMTATSARVLAKGSIAFP